jgi:dephospho-CoA kinase
VTRLYRLNPILSDMKRRILLPLLVVVGPPCAGKTEFTRVAAQAGLLCIEWSAVLEETLSGTTSDRDRFLRSVERAVSSYGTTHFPAQIVTLIKNRLQQSQEYRGIVVSGARNPAEIRALLKHFTRSEVLMVQASYQRRFERCNKRQRQGDPTELAEFLRSDLREYRSGLAEIGSDLVTVFLFNDDELPRFQNEAQSFLDHWLGSEQTTGNQNDWD